MPSYIPTQDPPIPYRRRATHYRATLFPKVQAELEIS
jgi:hypothetical protein